MSGKSAALRTPPRGSSDVPVPGTVDSDATVPLPVQCVVMDYLKDTSDCSLDLNERWKSLLHAVTQEQSGMDFTVTTYLSAIEKVMAGDRQLTKDANRVKLIKTSREVSENYKKFRDSLESACAAADKVVKNRVEKYAISPVLLEKLKNQARQARDACASSSSDDE